MISHSINMKPTTITIEMEIVVIRMVKTVVIPMETAATRRMIVVIEITMMPAALRKMIVDATQKIRVMTIIVIITMKMRVKIIHTITIMTTMKNLATTMVAAEKTRLSDLGMKMTTMKTKMNSSRTTTAAKAVQKAAPRDVLAAHRAAMYSRNVGMCERKKELQTHCFKILNTLLKSLLFCIYSSACLYPHGWYALLGQILAVLAFIVTILGYVSCYSAQQGDHNMSFVGQDLVTHRNNSYAGCLSWPHNHPPELDQMWKIGKSMDVVSMISGIICVVWILTFACFRWAKPLRYILIALFLFTGCAAGLALLAFKSKLCHTDPYHCNIVPAAIISGCAALNWFVCAFIIWHLQDPDDREDEDFDDEEDDEDDDDDNDRVKKSGHRRKPEVIVEDLPDGSRKITKIKRRSDGSEKITETIIPAEEINYQQEHVKPYPEPEPMDAQTPQEEEYDDDQDSEAAPMVETFRDEPREGDDGFVTGFKAEPYHVPGQPTQEADWGKSREMHIEPELETNQPDQLLLLPMNDAHEEHQSNQSTPAVSDLLDDHHHEATANEQEAHSATAVFAAPHNADLLDDNAVVAAPRQPDLLDHFGYNTGDDESKDMLFHDDDDDDDEDDDEDVADLLRESNQRPAPPLQPQLTRPDDFRLKSEDYDNGIPLDPPTAPQLLAPAPRLDPPVHYSIDDDDDDDDRHVPEIV